MLDRKLIRNNPEAVAEAVAAKNEKASVELWLSTDQSRRQLMLSVEELRSRRNALSKAVSAKKANGENTNALMTESRDVGDQLSTLLKEIGSLDAVMETVEMSFPNIPDSDVPRGGEECNLVLSSRGDLPAHDFIPRPHWELMEGTFSSEAAGSIAGSNFILFRGWAAKLQRTLINWMLDYHTEAGMEEVWAPFLANSDSMTATAQLPKMADDMYLIDRDGLYLIPTGEVPITNLYRNHLIPEEDIPVRLCGYTPCFRREAGSYGKETRGLNRVHQFEKVEMVRLEHPERSDAAHEEMERHVTGMLELLGIPNRTVLLASGDLSFAAARCLDIEIWAAGQQRWLEVSSISNFRDFQARRANIRLRPAQGGKPVFVHTLNGSGLALPRLIISIVENGQTRDGSIRLPGVLAERMGTGVIPSRV